MSKKASAKRTPATTTDSVVTVPPSVAEKANRREQLRIQREAELKAAQRKKRLTIGLGIVGVVVAGVLFADAFLLMRSLLVEVVVGDGDRSEEPGLQ